MTTPSRAGTRTRLASIVLLLVAAVALGAAVWVAVTGAGGPSIAAPGSAPPATAAAGAEPSASVLRPTAGSPSPGPTVSARASTVPAASTSPTPTGPGVAVRIRIPRLDIDLRVSEGDGIDAPLDRAAHYPGTAQPGEGSNIYIYAHARKGLFLSLWDVKVGDEVYLDTDDGRTFTYIVDDIRPRARYDAVHLLDPTPHEQLTLQTSTSYTATAPRFVVIALPAP